MLIEKKDMKTIKLKVKKGEEKPTKRSIKKFVELCNSRNAERLKEISIEEVTEKCNKLFDIKKVTIDTVGEFVQGIFGDDSFVHDVELDEREDKDVYTVYIF